MTGMQVPGFDGDLTDGIDLLPTEPGIYCFFNRYNGRRWVGLASSSMRSRARQHRAFFRHPTGTASTLVRDVRLYGADAFVFVCLEICPKSDAVLHSAQLRRRERAWAERLLALDERTGYNAEAGGVRSLASLFRDHERKLLRQNSRKYVMLPGVDIAQPIDPLLLASWGRSHRRAGASAVSQCLLTTMIQSTQPGDESRRNA